MILVATMISSCTPGGGPRANSQGSQAGYTVNVEMMAGSNIHAPSGFEVRIDPEVCGKTRPPLTLQVNKSGGLKYAVAWLDGGPSPAWSDSPDEKPMSEAISETNCEYSPRIVIVPPGGTVHFFNRDSVMHGIRSKSQINRPIYLVHPPNLQSMKLKFERPEIVPIACDFHPWERAFVVVAPHRLYAISNDEGVASFKNVPPGTYRLRLWHEIAGFQEKEDIIVVDKNLNLARTLEPTIR